MRPILALSCALLLPLPSLRATIDFTPVTTQRVVEDMVFPELNFHEDGRKISYEPPRGWTYAGGGASFRLIPPQEVTQAQVEMRQSPLLAPQNFDEASCKLLQNQVFASVPSGAQNVTLVGVEQNPVAINRRETFGVTVSYTFSGQVYLLNVLFCNLPDTQVRFRCSALKPEFEAVFRSFRGSLCTLQWLETPVAPTGAPPPSER